MLRLRHLTATQIVWREADLRHGSAQRIRREICRLQQPIHVASQQGIIRWMVGNVEVIRHRGGRWWRITSEQRQETRFPTDVGTEERREVCETRPALLLRCEPLIPFDEPAVRI